MHKFFILGIISFFLQPAFGQSGTITFSQYCPAGYSQEWPINNIEGEVRFDYKIDIDLNGDLFAIQSVPGSYPALMERGYKSGTILVNGRGPVVSIHTTVPGWKNIIVHYTTNTSQWDFNDLNVPGNANISGSSTVVGNSTVKGAILAQGAYGAGWIETNLSAGTRMLWYPRKAAFRAGHVNSTQWDNANIGNYSFANGFNTISSGTSSIAMGHDTKATNSYAVAMGMQATASNMSSMALGYQVTASGKYATALGYGNGAIGEHAISLGKWVNATEMNSMVIGLGVSSANRLVNNIPNSLMIGFNTTAPTLFVGSKVGIGTDKPDEMLTVKGKIHALEVIIDMQGPLADFVFDPTYNLMPLNKVEEFVKANRHLPEIPSAAEVEKKGLSMGEMQNKLLQKIEELTLYVIEQQKQIEELKKAQK